METVLWTLGSVLVISLASLVGVFALGVKTERLQKILIYMVAFSAGALLGDVFLHLLPEFAEHSHGLDLGEMGLLILAGVVFGLVIEKLLHWHHCHHAEHQHPQPLARMNLIGDLVHNLMDGLIIGASFLVTIPAGIATSLAILFHEIPQEIGDFAVLIHGGYSKKKALLLNFTTALSAILGAGIALMLGHVAHELQVFITPIAMGMFIYIAGSDLIPEMHKHNHQISASLLQIGMFVLGVGVMWGLLWVGHGHMH